MGDSPFLPSKLVDYLGMNLPIIALTPSEGASADLLEEVGGYIVSPTDPAAIAQILEEVAVLRRVGNLDSLRPDQEKAQKYSITSTTDILETALVTACQHSKQAESFFRGIKKITYVCPEHGTEIKQDPHHADILRCPSDCSFPLVNGIPRFVSTANYASSFGLQWNTFRKTQLDSYTNTSISQDRLSRILGGLDWLNGKNVLEAGCGAGRFSEVLLETGAFLYSLDLSNAVEAARDNCDIFPNHNVCQANILDMPYPPESFDAVVCIGVIQHTPNPEESIAALAHMVKPGGQLFIDHYAPGYPMPLVRRAFRSFLQGKNPDYRMHFCMKLRDLLWPHHVSFHARKSERLGHKRYRILNRFSPLVDYQDAYPQLSPETLREWALLDMHDLLTDTYKHLRTTAQIDKALVDNGLQVTRCIYAGNGVEAAARKPFLEQI
jgi:SAM-dependent methyltransferase